MSQLISQLMPYIILVIAYLIGSFPTSYLIGRIFYQTDIRQKGSGNTGATNALRTFGTKTGAVVLVIDILKGVAAIFIARYLLKHVATGANFNLIESLSGLFVIIGHIYSIFLGFKGGKGVATAAGVFLALLPLTLLFCLVLFSFIVYTSKYVSLGSMLTAFAFLVIELVSQAIMRFPNKPRLFLVLAIVILIIVRHKANLKRLLDGNENKFGVRTPQQEQ